MAADAVEVTGRILDLSGGVIPQAMTMGEGTGLLDGVTRARADEHGDFSMWVAPGPVTIHASAEGYAPERAEIVAPGRPLRIRLAPAGAIRGVVAREDSGAPVEAAVVMATMQPVPVSLAAPASLEVRTDASGRFALAPLPPGRYRVTAVHPLGRGQVSEPITLGFLESVDDVYLTMRAGLTARGHVRFAGDDSRVCTSGSVELYRQGASFSSPILEDGSVGFRGLVPGSYTSEVFCDNATPDEGSDEPLVIVDAPIDDVVWVVNDGATIRGRVVDEVGTSVAGIPVHAQRVESGVHLVLGGGSRSALSDEDGHFTLHGLSGGNFVVSADPSPMTDYAFAGPPVQVRLAADITREGVTLQLARGATIEGTVTADSGALPDGVRVHLRAAGSRQAESINLQPDGSFAFVGRAAGTYEVSARSGSWERSTFDATADTKDTDDARAEVSVQAGETQTVSLRLGRVDGRIAGAVQTTEGARVDDAVVQLSRGEVIVDTVVTDREGQFEFKDLAPSDYLIVASRGQDAVTRRTLARPGDSPTLTLEATATLGGLARIDGAPVSTTFTVTLERGDGALRTETFENSDGRWRIPGLAAGEYRLLARASSVGVRVLGPFRLSSGEAQEDLVLELQQGQATIKGRCADLQNASDGLPLIVQALASVGDVTLALYATPANDFELTVPAGDMEVTCTRGGELLGRRQVNVSDGQLLSLGELQNTTGVPSSPG